MITMIDGNSNFLIILMHTRVIKSARHSIKQINIGIQRNEILARDHIYI